MAFEQLTAANSAAVQRLICNVQAAEKQGKSHFALGSGPQPCFYFCFDPNGMEIAKRIYRETGQDIRIASFAVPDRESKQSFYVDEWSRFRAQVREALAEIDRLGSGRVVVDTLTNAYDLARVASLGVGKNARITGALTQSIPINYGAVNAELTELFNEVYESKASFIAISKLKNEYLNDKRTGALELDGWKTTPQIVQANFELMYDPALPGPLAGKFRIYVKNNNQAMWMQGWQMPPELGAMPFTADWFSFQSMLDWTFAAVAV